MLFARLLDGPGAQSLAHTKQKAQEQPSLGQFACRDLAEQGGSGEGSEGEESGTSGKDKGGRTGDLEAAPTHLGIAVRRTTQASWIDDMTGL